MTDSCRPGSSLKTPQMTAASLAALHRTHSGAFTQRPIEKKHQHFMIPEHLASKDPTLG